MIICAAGDIHGAMDRMYEDVLAFEAALGVRFAWVLHVGDFGVWPDPSRIDKATKKHDGAGDFGSVRQRAKRATCEVRLQLANGTTYRTSATFTGGRGCCPYTTFGTVGPLELSDGGARD